VFCKLYNVMLILGNSSGSFSSWLGVMQSGRLDAGPFLLSAFPLSRFPAFPLDRVFRSDYRNYMKTKVVRIGNSRGIRIPAALLEAYQLQDGDELEIDRRREGILLSVSRRERTLSYEDSYREMQAEAAERPEWAAWDSTTGDGLAD
jgi:antitoxin component of MazEF toxin-antitoxin module